MFKSIDKLISLDGISTSIRGVDDYFEVFFKIDNHSSKVAAEIFCDENGLNPLSLDFVARAETTFRALMVFESSLLEFL